MQVCYKRNDGNQFTKCVKVNFICSRISIGPCDSQKLTAGSRFKHYLREQSLRVDVIDLALGTIENTRSVTIHFHSHGVTNLLCAPKMKDVLAIDKHVVLGNTGECYLTFRSFH